MLAGRRGTDAQAPRVPCVCIKITPRVNLCHVLSSIERFEAHYSCRHRFSSDCTVSLNSKADTGPSDFTFYCSSGTFLSKLCFYCESGRKCTDMINPMNAEIHFYPSVSCSISRAFPGFSVKEALPL